MNMRKWFLSIVGIATLAAICFLFFKNNTPPLDSVQPTAQINLPLNEENTRSALNEIGQFLTKSYETIDYIDEELSSLSADKEVALPIIGKVKETLAVADSQLTQGDSSLVHRLNVLLETVNQLITDNDTKTAFKETIQDFTEQQNNLSIYIHSIQEKVALAEEKINTHA